MVSRRRRRRRVSVRYGIGCTAPHCCICICSHKSVLELYRLSPASLPHTTCIYVESSVTPTLAFHISSFSLTTSFHVLLSHESTSSSSSFSFTIETRFSVRAGSVGGRTGIGVTIGNAVDGSGVMGIVSAVEEASGRGLSVNDAGRARDRSGIAGAPAGGTGTARRAGRVGVGGNTVSEAAWS